MSIRFFLFLGRCISIFSIPHPKRNHNHKFVILRGAIQSPTFRADAGRGARVSGGDLCIRTVCRSADRAGRRDFARAAKSHITPSKFDARVGNDLCVVPQNFARREFDLQIVGVADLSDPQANTVRPYGVCVIVSFVQICRLARADEVTALPLPFCRYATFPLLGESSSAPTGCAKTRPCSGRRGYGFAITLLSLRDISPNRGIFADPYKIVRRH